MTCREASNLLPLFFDGELDARQMRAVALHDTRCPECEAELRRMERLHDVINDTLSASVDEIDLSNFWPAIDRQLGTVRLSWWERVRTWWSEREPGWALRIPAFAAAGVIAVLVLLLLMRAPQSQPSSDPGASQLALGNGVDINSLEADVDWVTVLSDPVTRDMALWVSDEGRTGGDEP